MATKINMLRQQEHTNAVFLSSWLEKQGVTRTEQVNYVRSGWLQRISTGVYMFAHAKQIMFSALESYGKQTGRKYHIGASSALSLRGYNHFLSMGKPSIYVFTNITERLPKWMFRTDWDMTLHEFCTKAFGNVCIEQFETDEYTLSVSSPERAIMECLLLSPEHYSLMDVYYLMEMLTTLRSKRVMDLLENCSSVKVKRLFLYMAEKARHPWFKKLDLDKVDLGSGPRSIMKGGIKNSKYNIIISRELAEYE